MQGLNSVFLFAILKSITGTQASKCNNKFEFSSSYWSYLQNHVVQTSSDSSLPECSSSCLTTDFCKSTNFNFANNMCELNNADKFDFPLDLVPKEGFSYSGFRYREKPNYKSCLEAKKKKLYTQSGYYTIIVRGKLRKIYCDMEKFGGGWSLVVSISKSNEDHLQTSENNCFDSLLCVKNNTNNVVARKLSDEDIKALASEEGTFRVEKLGYNPMTSFYQLPGGSQLFNSACIGSSCPGMILSHVYPYRWESNCKGLDVGYKIWHRVFDAHDRKECTEPWYSSNFSCCRVRYGANDGQPGVGNNDGFLFVR